MSKSESKVAKVVKRRVTLSGNVNLEEVIAGMPAAFPGLEVHVWKKRQAGKAASKKSSSKNASETPLEPTSEV